MVKVTFNRSKIMDLILIVLVLLLLFGGGGYWARGRYWGPRNPR